MFNIINTHLYAFYRCNKKIELPMKKISTPSFETVHTDIDVIDTKIVQPRKSTLDLLKQFARTYHFEKKIETSLGNIILN